MKVGDVITLSDRTDPDNRGYYGVVIRIDKDFYGASQAIKAYGVERGQAITPRSGNGIGPTTRGKRDRVLVLWSGCVVAYEESDTIEVVNEAG